MRNQHQLRGIDCTREWFHQLGLPGATGILYGVHAELTAVQPSSGEARAGQNPNLKGPVARYTVDFFIRGQDLILSQDHQCERSGKFLLGLKAYDHDGNALDWEGDEETVDIKPEEFEMIRKNGIPAHLNIDVPTAGDIHLVTAILWHGRDAGDSVASYLPGKKEHV